MVRLSYAHRYYVYAKRHKDKDVETATNMRHGRPSACTAEDPHRLRYNKSGEKIEPEHKGDRIAEIARAIPNCQTMPTTSQSGHNTEQDCSDCHPVHYAICIHADITTTATRR